MATITTRAGKGSPLTNDEVDANFTNLNTDKAELSGASFTGNVSFGDNDKAVFGAGSDLSIYHDGSNSYIRENGTGLLYIGATDKLLIQDSTLTNTSAKFDTNADVSLYYNNAKKLETTSTGIDVTGEVRSDSLKVDGGTNTEGLTAEVSGVVTDLTIGGITTGSDLRFSYNRGNGSTTISEGTRGSETNLQQWAGNGDISFYNDAGSSQDLYWDASTSRLGLGTTNPAYSLDVTGSSATIHVDNTAGSPDQMLQLWQADMGTNDRGIQLKSPLTDSNADFFRFATGNSVAFEIDGVNALSIAANKRIGIGTDVPATALEVKSSAGVQIRASNGSATFDILNDSTNSQLLSSGPMFYRTNGTGEHIFQQSGGSSEAMRIDANGNVGIGLSNPQIHGKVAIAGGKAGTANSNLSLLTDGAAQGELANLSLYGTFEGTADNGPRRTADIVAGYEGGSWGTEYLAFHVGTGGQNDNRLLTTERVRIDGSGNVGISNPNPDTKLHIGNINATNATAQGRIKIEDLSTSLTSVGGLEFVTSAFGSGYGWKINSIDSTGVHLAFGTRQNSTTWAEKARLDYNGNLLVGKTAIGIGTDGVELRESGAGAFSRTNDVNIYSNRNGTDGSAVDFRKNNSTVGTISVTSSATAYNTSSDQRLKDNIVDAPSASDDIDAIQVRSFDWKADGSHQKYGMVAQELNTVAPEAVSSPEDPEEMMGVDYSKLVPMLVKEIQSLRARVAQLEGAN